MINLLTTAFSIVVFVPIIIILYMAISKKLRLKPLVSGILGYTIVYIASRLFLILLSITGLSVSHPIVAVSFWGIITGISSIFICLLIFKRFLGNISFSDSVGYGLGLGTAWTLVTAGSALFFSLMMGITLSDVNIDPQSTTITAEALDAYNSAKANFESKTSLDYILLAVSGISFLTVITGVSIMLFEYIKSSDKKLLIYASSAGVTVTVPFIFAVETGFVNIYAQLYMVLLAIGAIWFIIHESKKYPVADTTPFVRQSPLEGRDFTKRIKKRK